MIKTKLTALTLAGLMAVASGAAFAESTTSSETPINKNATKLPGTNTRWTAPLPKLLARKQTAKKRLPKSR
ncbi:Uncharacterized protein ALO71_03832 [Pseudomonas amygdali pv. dendropanacis]|uniref:Uncharacterized protein n=1 Tax=Pseudomonas amygdali pv. dendropanacis TaxID=235272 RepID=A0A0N8RDU2_PSEA0|nr:Uncharacterized protein ALO71_03832 [Pseudomonas amygdali pv. dendropanacis]